MDIDMESRAATQRPELPGSFAQASKIPGGGWEATGAAIARLGQTSGTIGAISECWRMHRKATEDTDKGNKLRFRCLLDKQR
jgi:hypothetical protein